MTREEAIKRLKEIDIRAYAKELDKIYKPIEFNVLKESCEDCISRQAVLKLFATNDGKYLYEAIRDMDSVKVLTTDIKDKIISRMWNCRGKKTLTIDKVKMETIIREEFAKAGGHVVNVT